MTDIQFFAVTGFTRSLPDSDDVARPFYPLGFQDYEDALSTATERQFADLQILCKLQSDSTGMSLCFNDRKVSCDPQVAAMLSHQPTRKFLLKHQEHINAAHHALLFDTVGHQVTDVSDRSITIDNYGKVLRENHPKSHKFHVTEIIPASPSTEMHIVIEDRSPRFPASA